MTKSMEIILAVLFMFYELPLPTYGQCTLPFSDGTWLTNTRGTWTVSGGGTMIQGFSTEVTAVSLNCTQSGSTSTQYILSKTVPEYTCLDIQPSAKTPHSYIVYIVTQTNATTGEKFTSDLNSACVNTDYASPVNLMVVVQSGSETQAFTSYPDVILGNYSACYTDSNSVVTCGIEMDSCSDPALMNFNNFSSSSNLGFTTGNRLHCLYYAISGSSVYVITYNSDSSVNDNTTHRFACWVFSYSRFGTVGSVHPKECLANQTSTYVLYPGQLMDFRPYDLCPSLMEEEAGLPDWAVGLIVLTVVLVLSVFGNICSRMG